MAEEPKTDWVAIGKRLREAREYLGFTQDQVADCLKLPRSAVSLIEAGDRRVDSLEMARLAKLYRRPVGYFTGELQAEMGESMARMAVEYLLLDDNDKTELVKFAEFLHWRKRAKGE